VGPLWEVIRLFGVGGEPDSWRINMEALAANAFKE